MFAWEVWLYSFTAIASIVLYPGPSMEPQQVSTPAFSKPSPSILGARPVATKNTSAIIGSLFSPDNLILRPSGTFSTASTT